MSEIYNTVEIPPLILDVDSVERCLSQRHHLIVVDTLEDVVRGPDLVTYCSSGEAGDSSIYPIPAHHCVFTL